MGAANMTVPGDEVRHRLESARLAALDARGNVDELPPTLIANVRLGDISECQAYLDGALELFAIARAAYAAGRTATGDFHMGAAVTWAELADMCADRAGGWP